MGLRGLVSAVGLAALCGSANVHAPMGGYTPVSNVVEHAEIVLDIKDMTAAVNLGDLTLAKSIWEGGRYSCKSKTNVRTLKGFVKADTVTKKLKGQAFFDSFTNGQGPTGAAGPIPGTGRLELSTDFWDKFVSDAITGSGDFTSVTLPMRKVAINKGVLGVVTMYTARELESAISKAIAGSTADKDGAPYAWDEGWAFYYGPLKDGENSAWEFTKKRDLDYAYKNNQRVSAAVEGKVAVLNYFLEGLKASRTATLDVAKMVESRDNIYRIWALSAIRAALKYAFKAQDGGYWEDYHMEAYAYFLSAAGWVAQADKQAAEKVLALLNFKTAHTDLNADLYCAVKTALIPAYAKLGLDCDMVGTYKDLPPSKTCASLHACPTQQAALPTGITSYAPSASTTKGTPMACGYPPNDPPNEEGASAAYSQSLSTAWSFLAVAALVACVA